MPTRERRSLSSAGDRYHFTPKRRLKKEKLINRRLSCISLLLWDPRMVCTTNSNIITRTKSTRAKVHTPDYSHMAKSSLIIIVMIIFDFISLCYISNFSGEDYPSPYSTPSLIPFMIPAPHWRYNVCVTTTYRSNTNMIRSNEHDCTTFRTTTRSLRHDFHPRYIIHCDG